MNWLFSYQGRIGRPAYVLAAGLAFFVPHLLLFILWAVQGTPPPLDWRFWLTPLRWAFDHDPEAGFLSAPIALAGLALTAAGSWISAGLALRRAQDARLSGWFAALAIAPFVQIVAILVLAAAPTAARTDDGLENAAASTTRAGWISILQGLTASVGISVAAVALGALVFRTYGFGLFVATPVLIGGLTAFLTNRRRDIGLATTLGQITIGLFLGGLALVAVALEGIVCIVMAAPLAWFAAFIGALIGRAVARAGGAPGRQLMGLALLPLLFATDQAALARASFTDAQSIDVAASPLETWQAVLHMESIKEQPSLPFRLGVAYPMSGEVTGEGVGAIRRGYFSTGTAVERVTEWAPGEVLGFVIISEPPVLHELSPWPSVNAPHVDGYFRSVRARITLVPLPGGGTRLTLVTTHELDLDPVPYWMPLARWVVRENKTRVLGQMRAQAEQGAAPGAVTS